MDGGLIMAGGGAAGRRPAFGKVPVRAGRRSRFEWARDFGDIALLAGFMAKANYPGKYACLFWTQAGADTD